MNRDFEKLEIGDFITAFSKTTGLQAGILVKKNKTNLGNMSLRLIKKNSKEVAENITVKLPHIRGYAAFCGINPEDIIEYKEEYGVSTHAQDSE